MLYLLEEYFLLELIPIYKIFERIQIFNEQLNICPIIRRYFPRAFAGDKRSPSEFDINNIIS